MGVRGKLVELLNEMQDSGIIETPAGFGFTKQYIENERIASYLIAHGVTVQECGHWIKTKTNSTCSKCGGNVISWTGDYDGYERERGICLMHYCPHYGAKMMPQPPKGE